MQSTETGPLCSCFACWRSATSTICTRPFIHLSLCGQCFLVNWNSKAVNLSISLRRLHSAGFHWGRLVMWTTSGGKGETSGPLSLQEAQKEFRWWQTYETFIQSLSLIIQPPHMLSSSHLHVAVDPGQDTPDFGVNTGLVSFTAAFTPAGDAHQEPTVSILTHQRSTAVPLRKRVHTSRQADFGLSQTLSVYTSIWHGLLTWQESLPPLRCPAQSMFLVTAPLYTAGLLHVCSLMMSTVTSIKSVETIPEIQGTSGSFFLLKMLQNDKRSKCDKWKLSSTLRWTTYPSLPDPASVVPKPEVQHAVPGGNSWSKAGRQAGWTWSGSHKKTHANTQGWANQITCMTAASAETKSRAQHQ